MNLKIAPGIRNFFNGSSIGTGSESVGSQFESGQLQEEVEWMNLKIAAGKNENIKEIYSFIYYNCFILR